MPSKPDPDVQSRATRLMIAGDPGAVRDGLLDLMTRPPLGDLSADQRGMAELVLAEVLNNIVEHAYAGSSGTIEIGVDRQPGGIACLVSDHGVPLPSGPPPGKLPPGMDGDPADLPEGGFGWHLIHALTRDLSYRRVNDRNHLSFLIPADPG